MPVADTRCAGQARVGKMYGYSKNERMDVGVNVNVGSRVSAAMEPKCARVCASYGRVGHEDDRVLFLTF
jgi:hypothetical protein